MKTLVLILALAATPLAGNQTVAARISLGNTASNSSSLTVDPTPVAPVIATQPSSRTTNVGLAATFTVTATGTAPFTYQWSKDGAPVAGATTDALTIGNARQLDSGTYTVTVTNAAGSSTSAAAALWVDSHPVYTFSTLAGQAGFSGSTDATGSAARFYGPTGVAIDSAGNVYVADTYNQTIRKISATGAVTTVAGTVGLSGNLNAIGTAARFSYPRGLALDTSGTNLFVADSGNGVIRKIVLATGAVSQWASVSNPQYLVGDNAGNLCVTAGDSTLQKVTAAGAVSTLAGTAYVAGFTNAVGAAARFYFPLGIARDGAGYLYVADYYSGAVRMISPDASVTTLAGGPPNFGVADGPAHSASFYYPVGVAVDAAGSVFVGDGYTIRKIAGGMVRTIGGAAYSYGSTDGPGAMARFGSTAGLALDGAGNLYVVDSTLHTIRKGTPSASPLAPAIMSPPQHQAVSVGANVAFSVAVSGLPPLAYEWRKNGVALAGASTATLALAQAQPADVGTYTVLVTNALGAAVSPTASLTVDTTLVTLTNALPVSGLTDGAGGQRAFSLHVPAGQTQLVLQLMGGSGDADLYVRSGTTPTLTSYDFRSTVAGNEEAVRIDSPAAGEWRIMISGFASYTGVTLLAAHTASPVAPVIATPPRSLAVTVGQSANFVVTVNGTPPLTYQWRRSGANLAGATNATLAINGITTSQAGNYDVVVTNNVGSATSTPATLTVLAAAVAPTILVGPRSQTVAVGAIATLSVTAGGTPPFSYQWRKDGATIPGATVDTLTLPNLQAAGAGNYSVEVTNSAGSAASGFATLTVNPPGGAATNDNFADARVLVGNSGSVGGDNAGTTRFYNAWGIVADGAGNLYVGDTVNHTIRKISAAGVTTTLAGVAGASGSSDGIGSAARFNHPEGMVLDASGNILVADSGNHTIRRVTPTGVVTTVAGLAGNYGSQDGIATAARFSMPHDVAVDRDGNMFVADAGNHTIRKITPIGVVTTVAGLAGTSGSADGTGTEARFNYPYGLGVDSEGNAFVADTNNYTVRKISPDGTVSTLAGLAGVSGSADGSGAAARFSFPSDIIIDPYGDLYVAAGAIRRVYSNGLTTTFSASGGNAITFDGAGNIFAVTGNYINKVSANGAARLYAGDLNLPGSSDGTISASGETGEPMHVTAAGTASSVWYAWTPTATGIATLDTFGSTFDTVLAVYLGGSLTGLTPLAQDDDSGGNHASKVTIYVNAGLTYRIAVGSWGPPRGGITLNYGLLAAPSIAAQPVGQTVVAGRYARFAVGAHGGGLTYQWYRNGVAIPAATGASCTIGSTLTTDAGSYHAVVTNALGSATSATAALTVDPSPPGIAWAWGRNSSGQTTVPAGLGSVSAISAGNDHTLALKSDGTVAAWGGNTSGQTTVPAGLGDVVAIAAGFGNSFALKSDGTVVAWGHNYDGASTVPAGLANVRAIASGGHSHTLALKHDGTVAAWGYNYDRQATVPAGLVGVTAVAAGGNFSIALKNDGTIVGWGFGYYGQTTPPPGLSDVVAIAAGYSNTLALKSDGTVVAFGASGAGSIPPGLTGVVAITAGESHYMALKSDGTVVAWGSGTTNTGSMPHYGQSIVNAGLNGVTVLDAGSYHSVAVFNLVAPFIATPPSNQEANAGQYAALSVVAGGTAPLSYQWKKNRVALPWGTSASLVLPAMHPSDAGTYSVVVSNYAGSATSDEVTVTVNYAPAITVQPQAQTATAGASVSFSVTATGHPTPAYQWRRDALALGGATSATLTLASVQSADAGSYDVVVSNPLGGVTSAAATLTVHAAAVAPTITTQPLPQLAYAGQTVTFAVVAHGTAPLTYQWFKDSTARGGATTATLVLPNVQPADAGIYTVVITNGAGNATSRDATLSVIPSGFTGQHAVIGHGYLPGGTVQITTMIAYTGTLSGLGYQVLLPAGLSYAAGSGTEAEIKPVAGKVGLLEWTWTTLPASPVTFTYTLNFAPGTTGPKNLSGLITTHPGPILFLSQPDPLVVNQITHHSADTDRNFRLSLNELTRVIEIYNTYHGTVRTGCYAGLTGTEDGYVAAPGRIGADPVILTNYHSADSNCDGKIALLELTRVIELYNFRSGTTRTGQYHVQAGTEDGFAPGP